MIFETGEGLAARVAVSYYEENENSIGIIERAVMRREDEKSILQLIDENGDSLEIAFGVSAGCFGAGAYATLEILRKAGFDVDEKFIFINESFELVKEQMRRQ